MPFKCTTLSVFGFTYLNYRRSVRKGIISINNYYNLRIHQLSYILDNSMKFETFYVGTKKDLNKINKM